MRAMEVVPLLVAAVLAVAILRFGGGCGCDGSNRS